LNLQLLLRFISGVKPAKEIFAAKV